jgi:hypothetical protein
MGGRVKGYVSVHVSYPDFEILCVSTGDKGMLNAIEECESDMNSGSDHPMALDFDFKREPGQWIAHANVDTDRWYEVREVTVHE